jgi:hypothetical protein
LLPEGLGRITGSPVGKLGCEHLPLATGLVWIALVWIVLVGIVLVGIVVGHGCPVVLKS